MSLIDVVAVLAPQSAWLVQIAVAPHSAWFAESELAPQRPWLAEVVEDAQAAPAPHSALSPARTVLLHVVPAPHIPLSDATVLAPHMPLSEKIDVVSKTSSTAP